MSKAVQLENETSDSQQVSKNEVQDEETRSVSISFFIHRLIAYADARRSIAAFIFSERITHVSTGGGASLEFLEGKELPGVSAIRKSK